MRLEKKPTYTRESDLCADFIAALPDVWTAYAETEGWDILLVHSDGTQIGVEAKLSLNAKVITQALSDLSLWNTRGPDFRAVLVPSGVTSDLAVLCAAVGIQVIRCQFSPTWRDSQRYRPSLPDDRNYWGEEQWHQWCPTERCRIPDYVPDVGAGNPSPNKLSLWKVKAIKIAIIAETRPVKRSDFKALSISPTRWTERSFGWLTPTPEGYVPNDRMPDFKAQHPVNYEQIRTDIEKWAPNQSRLR